MASKQWNTFISNSQEIYNPIESVVADEQLYPIKSRCPFNHALLYRGKNGDRPSNEPLGEYVVFSYKNSGIIEFTCKLFLIY
ncbi:hypothetical protein J437_LFUL011052 [Ladona fulva]|uniref:Uncharacterized protein n=1 Tax=Ladona fulva TaxID=123851 RepID=A0A8K0K9M6_LADFU|nr:hypothetical protein J437_LFUL011052 [Ladona fulva]